MTVKLWRVTPVARADFGRRTVWHVSEDSARKTQGAFAEGLADPVGLYIAEIEPEHVVCVPNARSLPSERALAYADELIAEGVGHRWLVLWDGSQPGGDWETWVYLGDEQIEARPVRDAEVFIPPGWK